MAEDTGTNTRGKGFSSRASSNFREECDILVAEHARLVEAMKAAAAAGQFMAGDLVVLKSGGPVMTVKGMYPNGHMVSCVWFVADGDLKAEAFDVRCLRHIAKGDKVA